MDELINKQEVVDLLNERASSLCGIYGDLGGACSGAAKLIMQMPTVEPQIIQCKDCDYYIVHRKRGVVPVCGLIRGTPIRHDDDFCSRAERRGEQDGRFNKQTGGD